MKQTHAVTTQSVRAANQYVDSLSQYSKHSDELGGGSELMSELNTKSKISAIYSTKKNYGSNNNSHNHGNEGHAKFGKTQKKLPDLAMGHYES